MENYDDIINIEYPTSRKYKKMPLISRAVQFAPFAALTGFDEQVNETARFVDECHELTDDEKNMLDMNMQLLEKNIEFHPTATIVYFVKDDKKSGCAYHKISGRIRRIEKEEGIIIFENEKRIQIKDIMMINTEDSIIHNP